LDRQARRDSRSFGTGARRRRLALGGPHADAREGVPERLLFLFFQAEDGIRDRNVTGVQTCALPIYRKARLHHPRRAAGDRRRLLLPRHRPGELPRPGPGGLPVRPRLRRGRGCPARRSDLPGPGHRRPRPGGPPRRGHRQRDEHAQSADDPVRRGARRGGTVTASTHTVRTRPRRTARVVVVTGAALVAATAVSVLIGARATPPAETLAALVAGPGGEVGGDLSDLVWRLRVPRTVLALLAGASLAVAGALAQVWTRNPMAGPGIIGITSGAGLAVAIGTVAGLTAPASAALLALRGAALVAALVLAVARAADDPLTVLLVGVATAFALTAVTTVLALHQRSVLDGIRQWTVGSTVGRGGTDLVIAAVGLSVGLVLAA